MGIIYKVTNQINGKIYVGRDKHNNPKYLGSGKLLQYAFKKYSAENFKKEIIEYCQNEDLDSREKYWIKQLDAQNPEIGYNIADGGHNDFTMNDYVKSKISQTLKGKYTGKDAFRYGLKLSDEHRKAFTENAGRIKGKTFEDIFGKEKANEIKKKISNSLTGVKFSNEHREAISMAKKGFPLTDKQRKGISEGLKGHIVTEETKQKLKNSNLNKTQKNSIKIECVNIVTGEFFYFNNVEHAKREMCCSRYQIMQNKLIGFEIKRMI